MALLGSICNYLSAQGAVTSLVGDRVYPVKLPQGVGLPAIEVRVSAATHAQKLTGMAGLGTAIVTIDCLSVGGPNGAEQIASAIIELFKNGHRGDMAGTNIRSLAIFSGPEQFEESVDPGTNTTRFVSSLQYEIAYSEPCST